MERKTKRSWKECALLTDVDTEKCFKQGQDDALDMLKESGVFSDDELDISRNMNEKPGVDVLRPCIE